MLRGLSPDGKQAAMSQPAMHRTVPQFSGFHKAFTRQKAAYSLFCRQLSTGLDRVSPEKPSTSVLLQSNYLVSNTSIYGLLDKYASSVPFSTTYRDLRRGSYVGR